MRQADRQRVRGLFDSVANLYNESRQDFPGEVVRSIVETAGLAEGADVLEIGCGTGQLTAELARWPLRITAIDIGPSMIEVARRRLGDRVRFQVAAFEEFEARPRFFDLVACATAFHWLDPEIAWIKTARILKPSGWLAIAYIGEEYADPFGSELRRIWIDHSVDCGAWASAKNPTFAEQMIASGLFDTPVARSHSALVELTAKTVMGVERTRATYLAYEPAKQSSFDAALDAALEGAATVSTKIQATVTMAHVVAI